MRLIFSLVIGIGELYLRTGQEDRGLALLALALNHPASEQGTKSQAQRRLDRHEPALSSRQLAALAQHAEACDLEAVIDELQERLAVLEAEMDTPPRGTEAEAPPRQPLVEPLTPRELEVLQLIAKGLTNQQIADTLILSLGTVKWHTSQIYGKLGVGNRTQAVAQARRLGLERDAAR